MKTNSFLPITCEIGFLLALIISLHCKKDNNSGIPLTRDTTQSIFTGTFLKFDYRNISAPTLDPNTYQAAVRFSASKVASLVGWNLIEVYYFIENKPQTCKIKIYGPSTELNPGDILYSADVTNEVSHNQWNIHKLAQPITLKAEDIWISVEFSLTTSISSIGCDQGPTIEGGDWLYEVSDSSWQTYRARTGGGENINWNIRGKLSQ